MDVISNIDTGESSQDVVNAINAVTTYAIKGPSGGAGEHNNFKALINNAFITAQLTDPIKSAFDFSKFGSIKVLNNGVELTDAYFAHAQSPTNMVMTYTYDGITTGSTALNVEIT